jgi:hypothetical protein
MLPIRYNGWFHAFKLIASEEGIKGLYRGFLAYAVVVISNIDFLTFKNAFSTFLILHLAFYSDYAYDLKFEN